jgi:hypothetical protein
MEMKCIFNIGKKYFYIGQGYSGERCGPWASCFKCCRNVECVSIDQKSDLPQIQRIDDVQSNHVQYTDNYGGPVDNWCMYVHIKS